MLKIDLALLRRQGTVDLQAEVSEDDPLWEGSGLEFDGPVRLKFHAQETPGEEIVVRGTVAGALRSVCRRCLDPVRTELDQELTLVYAPEDPLLGPEGEDARPIAPRARELELGDAIREEILLLSDPFPVCGAACRGLCPQCGTNLNLETCECVGGGIDPRWDVLRTLKSE
jgi:uncharacterized protein